MHVKELIDNGKYGHTIVYRNDQGDLITQSNCYFCCSGEVTDTLDKEQFFCIYFECVNPNKFKDV